MAGFQHLKEEFERRGFVVLRGVLEGDRVSRYKKILVEMAGNYQKSWTLPDGVAQTEAFWEAVTNPRLHGVLESLFDGEGYAFLQHNDLHVGFSSPAWHRDSINRTYGVGPDWDESIEPYRLVRVGTYLQEFAGSGFKLGLIPGSHRPAEHLDPEIHKQIERRSGTLAGGVKMLSGKDFLEDFAEWVATEPGDCVIFDPRVLHTGSRFEGAKFSFFMGFGVPNSHFFNHYHYYRHLRKDLGYRAFPEGFAALLKSSGLYAPEKEGAGEIEGAWVPGATYNRLAKWFKS